MDSDDVTSERQPRDVLWKLFLLQFTIAVALAYLARRRNLSPSLRVGVVVSSIAVPAFPLIEIVHNIWATFLRPHRPPYVNLRYSIGCLLGESAGFTNSEEVCYPLELERFLVDFDPKHVSRKRRETNYPSFAWVGKLILHLVFLAQPTTGLTLSIRRIIFAGIGNGLSTFTHSFALYLGRWLLWNVFSCFSAGLNG